MDMINPCISLSVFTPQDMVCLGLVITKRLDGTVVPLSMVYRIDLLNEFDGNYVMLHAYGAYGCCMNPMFNANRLSLLDRGFIYVIAHGTSTHQLPLIPVRGGADMGNAWYEDGKLDSKSNTFHDFISVAEHLIKEGYTTPQKLSIYGRSAGGLLIGACINLRPDLFQAAIVEVPFVDVLNTMSDSKIPWTAFEFEEWGNPADEVIYKCMHAYCPYSNVNGGDLASNRYPNMLVLGGLNDPRVCKCSCDWFIKAFFEPLKWVAKMRSERSKHRSASYDRSSDRLLLLKIDDGGHAGSSDSSGLLAQLAFKYAFIIKFIFGSSH
jgi:oligopeptidase B